MLTRTLVRNFSKYFSWNSLIWRLKSACVLIKEDATRSNCKSTPQIDMQRCKWRKNLREELSPCCTRRGTGRQAPMERMMRSPPQEALQTRPSPLTRWTYSCTAQQLVCCSTPTPRTASLETATAPTRQRQRRAAAAADHSPTKSPPSLLAPGSRPVSSPESGK